MYRSEMIINSICNGFRVQNWATILVVNKVCRLFNGFTCHEGSARAALDFCGCFL